jgi:hypothetical protein
MAIDIITTGVQLLYEDMPKAGKQLWEMLFSTRDESVNASIKIDEYTGQAYSARAVKSGMPSKVRKYEAGSGVEYTPVVHKEKTPIGEELSDAKVAGLPSTAPAVQHMRERARKIVEGPKGHVVAHNMAKNKAAIDVMRTGIFSALDENDTVQTVDFGRDSSLSFTYDLSSGTNSFDKAMKQLYSAMTAFGVPKGNLAVILGADWFNEFQTATEVKEKRKATRASSLITEAMQPPLLMNTQGLYVVGRYNVDGMAPPLWILTYDSDWPYLGEEGGSTAPYMPDDEAVMFSVNSVAWSCFRGVDAFDANHNRQRVVGELVFDNFSSDDPIIEWVRSQSRFMFIRGNINHTGRITGENFS